MAAAQRSSNFTFSSGFRAISVLLLGILLLRGVDGQNQSSEVRTLLQFKAMMDVNVPPITDGYWSTWKEADANPCAWYGVTCTTNFTVGGLDFQAWGLKLSNLSLLSNLKDLQQLDISRNDFISRSEVGSQGFHFVTIPDDISTLSGLTYLDLSYSSVTGPIPPSISVCTNLRYVYLQGNSLTGEIPDLSSLVNLQVLLLGQNKLSGPFPRGLGDSRSLVHLEFSNNFFNGTIPSLPNLTSLIEVYLDYNNFTGFEEPLFPGANSSLQHLTVKSNQIVGKIPASVTRFLNLKTLDMSDNQLSGQIPSDFSIVLNASISVDFSENMLTGGIPSSLLQSNTLPLANLPILNFSYNFLTGQIPFDETKQYNYWTLDFSYNNLSGPLPSICSNASSSAFVNFNFQNNSLSGDIVEFLAQCYGHMENLVLANNSFTGDLSTLTNTSSISDLLATVLNTQVNLVDLSNNKLQMSTMEGNPDPVRTMLDFFVLNTNLTEFLIEGNDFSGASLPSSLNSSSPLLQVLDLSNCHLKGEMSNAAFNSTWFPALQLLNLSNNDATGPVPEAVVLLPNLVILDLVNNYLSGPLPALLPNQLYNPSFFAGNGGLCGGPLRPCPSFRGVQWWVVFIIVGGSMLIAVGTCVAAGWRWRVYHKRHQQDSDLIQALLERESTALMSLGELKKATDNFAKTAKIGEGGFGTVYVGKLSNGTLVAIKRSKREGAEVDKAQFLNEVRILSQVNHRYLVKLLGCCMENKIALLVFEYVSNGTLQEHLRGKDGASWLSWKRRVHIVVQVADALNYLHSAAGQPIIHRDVKSANIMLDDRCNAKVADFGVSKLAPLEMTHVSTVAIQGTLGYIDPEYYTSYKLTSKSDVYSFGVVLLELLSARSAVDFSRIGEETSLVNFFQPHMESGDLHDFIDPTLIETYLDNTGKKSILNVGRLAMKCISQKSRARPSMKEVWKELQALYVEVPDEHTSKELGSLTQNENEFDLRSFGQGGQGVALSDTLSYIGSHSSPDASDSTFIQMSRYSHEMGRIE